MDAKLRDLERSAAGGDPQAAERYKEALWRAGAVDDALRVLVSAGVMPEWWAHEFRTARETLPGGRLHMGNGHGSTARHHLEARGEVRGCCDPARGPLHADDCVMRPRYDRSIGGAAGVTMAQVDFPMVSSVGVGDWMSLQFTGTGEWQVVNPPTRRSPPFTMTIA